ncbi:YfcL family protein [Alteromonas sp.]|nr:YfcL family protein [Alteromonas sp.]
MLPPAAAPQLVVDEMARIEAALDDVVNHGSDDELFIASYLQGHFAVEARQVEMQSDGSLAMLNEKMRDSLGRAFENNELDNSDAARVTQLWERLLDSSALI